jgi:hypothetical protein
MRFGMFCILVSFLFGTPSEAREVGTGLVCNSAEQVHRFIALTREHSAQMAIDVVNYEAKQDVCGVVTIQYDAAEAVARVDTFRIIRVFVLALHDDGGWHATRTPYPQFMIIAVEEREASRVPRLKAGSFSFLRLG